MVTHQFGLTLLSLSLYCLACLGAGVVRSAPFEAVFADSDHWVMACDNRGYCSAVGFPYDEKDALEDRSWYVKIIWHRNDKQNMKITLKTFLEYHNLNFEYGNFQICMMSEKCQSVNVSYFEEDRYKYSYTTDIDYADLIKLDYLTMSHLNAKNRNLYLDDFHNFINAQEPEKFEEPPAIQAVAWQESGALTETKVQEILKAHDEDADNRDERCAAEPSANVYFDFKEFGKIYAICMYWGYNSYDHLYKEQNGRYLPVPFPGRHDDVSSNDPTSYDEYTNFWPVEGSHFLFSTTFLNSSSGGTGEQINLVFDGERFRIVKTASMSKRASIDSNDWPVTYSMPFSISRK